jgi:hypothetical protein
MTAEPLLGPGEHPSPHRDRVRLAALLLALAAGPAAWILQLSVDFGVAAAACQPGGVPRPAPPASGWGTEHVFLVGVNLACLALAVAGGFVALAAWRRSSREKPGGAAHLMEAGEGRTRFLAACAMMAAAGFAVAILFDTAWPFFVPSCWRFAP